MKIRNQNRHTLAKAPEEWGTRRALFHFFFAGLFLAGLFLAGLFLAGLSRLVEPCFAGPFWPKTRAKILSTFFSWRERSKACSICWRGTRLVISLSASTSWWKSRPSFQARMGGDWT